MADSTGQQCSSPSRVWIPTALERVAAFLPANEVACTLRLVDKATAEQFRRPDFSTVRLLQPVPPHAFAWRWGRPKAARDLTLAKRRQLLSRTAASVTNLKTAIGSAGCGPTNYAAYWAGKAGQLGACLFLEQHGCSLKDSVEGAAAGGHLAMYDALLQRQGLRVSAYDCAKAAALNGQVAALYFMVERAGLQRGCAGAWRLLKDVAGACDLASGHRAGLCAFLG
ncbi:hypothetical protein GPECTOR_11g136 [Gonium pectorale]|uniref:Uncharacterized protein n=1 Tax=Gonium pectorale TaxID=33097 RepID=A0A150GPG3_GONPE|nr:hypothetical protein GPECTOR_11g136 [Gonium pectorale]|eukprot:KXZ51685.1 hypothetical protein GPECTOR_11g136 [Gonium pectorale]